MNKWMSEELIGGYGVLTLDAEEDLCTVATPRGDCGRQKTMKGSGEGTNGTERPVGAGRRGRCHIRDLGFMAGLS